MDRKAIAGGDAEHAEAVLKIVAGRLAAEIERSRTDEALRRAEASYRAIFETAEDSIFIHDWDTGAILDVNPKATETYGYTREELRRLSVADISSGVPPYTAEEALHQIQLARLGRGQPFEWHRRSKDGSLNWDEVRLKPAMINGQPHVLAFTRDITERRECERALQRSEARLRATVEAGQWVELSVGDDGCGIAPGMLERIFDPFFSTKAPGRAPGSGGRGELGGERAPRRQGRARRRRSDGGRFSAGAPFRLGAHGGPASRAAGRSGLAG